MTSNNYLPEDELLSLFDVSGHYYQLNDRSCRKLLEIRRAESGRPAKADALVIMMNPGSSKPESGGPPYLPSLVPAEPDDTQYQIMRIMVAWGWSFVNVINLSDLTQTKSKVFCKELKDAPDTHSIFDQRRAHELTSLIAEAGAFICAWGCDYRLRPLVAMATVALGGAQVNAQFFGLKGGKAYQFKHPLPPGENRRRKWLDDFLASKPLPARFVSNIT